MKRDSGEAVKRIHINDFLSSGKTLLTLKENGAYIETISMRELKDVVIYGDGPETSSLLFSPNPEDPEKQWCFVDLQNCANLTLCNFSVDWDWDAQPLASLLRVTQYNEAVMELEVLEGPRNADFWIQHRNWWGVQRMHFSDTHYNLQLTPVEECYPAKSIELFQPHFDIEKRRVIIKNPLNAFTRKKEERVFEYGCVVRVMHKKNEHHAFWVGQGCENVTFQNLRVYSAAGKAFVVNGTSGSVTVLNCDVAPKGRRCISATSDGLSCYNSIGPLGLYIYISGCFTLFSCTCLFSC
jgi:hypothetical protein